MTFSTSFTDIAGGLSALFGKEGTTKTTQDEERDLVTEIIGATTEETTRETGVAGTREEFLEIDPAGVERIVNQILGGTQGLSSIFGGEQTAGLYNTTVAAQAAGDLVAQLAGEIAKLTAKKKEIVDESRTETGTATTTEDKTETETGTISGTGVTTTDAEGLVEGLVDTVGGAVADVAIGSGYVESEEAGTAGTFVEPEVSESTPAEDIGGSVPQVTGINPLTGETSPTADISVITPGVGEFTVVESPSPTWDDYTSGLVQDLMTPPSTETVDQFIANNTFDPERNAWYDAATDNWIPVFQASPYIGP